MKGGAGNGEVGPAKWGREAATASGTSRQKALLQHTPLERGCAINFPEFSFLI